MESQELSLRRTRSSSSAIRSSRKIIPDSTSGHHFRSSSTLPPEYSTGKLLLHRKTSHSTGKLSSLLHSILKLFSLSTIIPIPTCKWLSIPTVSHSLGRKVTGTLFGHRRGHVSFAVQLDRRSEPVLLLELATSTASLVKEMSSGLVRIALESEKSGGAWRLFEEPRWRMYCNGRKCGYATPRACGEWDWRVLNTVESVSAGAGVIPVGEDGGKGELMYMRARFERVVGSRDSEAFYMMNPDGNGGPELSIFLLRI